MQPMMSGFVDELVKLAETKHHDDHGSRSYFGPMLVGAAAAPVLALAGKTITRMIHNHDIAHAAKTIEDPAKQLERLEGVHTGPVFGRARPDLPSSKRPLYTPGDVAGDVGRAILAGTAIQALRDRISKPKHKAKNDRG